MLKFPDIDEAYKGVLSAVLMEGTDKPSRTPGTYTKSLFGYAFKVPIKESFPLVTLKKMEGAVWRSLVHEFLWYLSGEEHILNLKAHTGIWNQWADETDRLTFSYGRYWRRFPLHLSQSLPGEAILDADHPHVYEDKPGSFVVDQIGLILDNLKKDPYGRRNFLTAWHPGNAHQANPPACHVCATFNATPPAKEGGRPQLNIHLHMRSNDLGLGAPFNWAQYALLCYVMAEASGLDPGYLAYSATDVHLYRSEEHPEYDQIVPAKKLLARDRRSCPRLVMDSKAWLLARKGDQKPLSNLKFEDFRLADYACHPSLKMACVP